MGARADALAKQFEAKAKEATEAIERLTDAEWKRITAAEKWSVGVVAHHIAAAHEIIAGVIKAVTLGQSPNMKMDDLHAMNAKHALDHAACTKSETIALHRKNAAMASAVVRGLDDADLDRSGVVIAGAPAMSAAQLAGQLLPGHIDEHLGSIRSTIKP
jgi:uncharacterized damage-inducible protein DinB